MFTMFCMLILGFISSFQNAESSDPDLLAVVIADRVTDKLRRYGYSAQTHQIKYKVLGTKKPWRDEDVVSYTDGGHKVNVLKENLEEYAQRRDLVILFTENTDSIFLESPKEILKRFRKFHARIVFSSDEYCWPDNSLKSLYPKVGVDENGYLNSGAFIGYANDIVDMVNHRMINDMESDQLYYTEIYTNKELRAKWNIKIDTKSTLFQNLFSSKDSFQLKSRDRNYIYNPKTTTTPIVIYGNGEIKSESNDALFLRLGDYLTGTWTSDKGCLSCKRNTISLKHFKRDQLPKVQLSIFIDQPTPFIREALELIGNLDYPKSQMDLFIYVHDELHERDVDAFMSAVGKNYSSHVILDTSSKMDKIQARHWALQRCYSNKCPYIFFVEGHVHLTDRNTLQDLIEQNRSVIAPMLCRVNDYWCNFWGELDANGYYARSNDYEDIVEFKQKGLWNVPHIAASYLINGSVVSELLDVYTERDSYDFGMSFCKNLREKGIFMYVTNTKERGHMVNFDDFVTTHLHNDLWQIFDNPHDWKRRYIHENYSQALEDGAVIQTPCSDVAWFPVVTERFCDEMVEEMENYGKWSNGKNEDPRLNNGYENVPTVDIHMNQIGYDEEWLHFLKTYAKPLQLKFFIGYDDDEPPRSLMNFVVRYRPNEQPILRPHHDISTWTINIALNTPGVDFTGGGCRFVRQNCSVTGTKKGWMLMHPGRLTHYHEGLRVLSGTRYILVSFVDP